jgi:hypothetical protein
MRQDALDAINLKGPAKIPGKETLNNYELFWNTSGIDPYENFQLSYTETIKELGIDFFGGVPENSDAVRITKGETLIKNIGKTKRAYNYLGVAPTYSTIDYGFHSYQEVISYEPEKENPIDVKKLQSEYLHKYQRSSSLVGDFAQPYHLYYTTLFMWPVEVFGWELFMEAAMYEPDGFNELLEKFTLQSIKHAAAWSELDVDFMMFHDDLCMSTGPVFSPSWYEKYIFPKYFEIFEPLKKKNKKIIFTSDGNIDCLLDNLVATGVDGFMVETPATNFDNILKKHGKDKVVIGGIDTRILTFGTPGEVFEHAKETLMKGRDCPGFFFSSPGGIHGNIPYENLEAYFEAKRKHGYR